MAQELCNLKLNPLFSHASTFGFPYGFAEDLLETRDVHYDRKNLRSSAQLDLLPASGNEVR